MMCSTKVHWIVSQKKKKYVESRLLSLIVRTGANGFYCLKVWPFYLIINYYYIPFTAGTLIAGKGDVEDACVISEQKLQ